MASTQSTVTQQTERTVGRQYRPLYAVVAITTVVLGGIGGRLAHLQLVEGPRNRELATSNRIRLEPRAAERGALLDAKGRVLAGSRLAPSLFLWPVAQPPERWVGLLPQLASILAVPEAELSHRLERAGYRSPALVRVASGLDAHRATALAELSTQFEGIELEIERVRYYPYGGLARAVLGQVGTQEVSEATQPLLQERVVGLSGLEAALDDRLRGVDGGQQVELDASFQRSKILAQKNPQSGFDVQLTLDLDVQRAVETAFGDRAGVVVALNPNDGSVVALLSRASGTTGETGSTAPTISSTGVSSGNMSSALAKSTTNLALVGDQPGLMLQPLLALIGLESGQLKSRSAESPTLLVNPRRRAGLPSFTDWQLDPAPWTLAQALQTSLKDDLGEAIEAKTGTGSTQPASGLNPNRMAERDLNRRLSLAFWETLAQSIAPDDLLHWLQRFGFGGKTGFELAQEETGSTDLTSLANTLRDRSRWYAIEKVETILGRGDLRVSPLQLTQALAVLANGGVRIQPHVVQGNGARSRRERLDLSQSHLALLRASLARRPLRLPTSSPPTASANGFNPWPQQWPQQRPQPAPVTTPSFAPPPLPFQRQPALPVPEMLAIGGIERSISRPDRAWYAALSSAAEPRLVVLVVINGSDSASDPAEAADNLARAEDVARAAILADGQP